ncbi:MAG: Na/Pi cotransporter family protein [Acholeplasmatales bacterium]|nr:Na/Pi cotransporter family protein [Acholeplasmatales bacterium]
MFDLIVKLLVGLVVFVTGMNFMSKGLKACAGGSIRRLFKKIKDNRIASASIGAGTTAIVQSSGATTVMVVGFLGTGAFTFTQGFSVMLGAHLGTTITGILVSLSGFSFSIYLMSLAFIGFILGFFKSENVRSVGEILVGFGILFFGLEAMKATFQDEEISKNIVSFLKTVDFPLLLMVFGALLTCLTQSSSATNGIVIVMVAQNPKLIDSGFYLVLGATIGAMMPAFLASLKSNILAKRVTYSMILVRILGAFVMTLIVWAISGPLFDWIGEIVENKVINVGMLLALFTVIYNVIFILICMPLITPIEGIANRMFKDKESIKKKQSLHYIDDNLLNTPSLAVVQVRKEIENMFNLAKTNMLLGLDAIVNVDLSNSKDIEAREEEIDYINTAISDYLIKLSAKATLADEMKIGSYYHVINDIERIGDHAYNFLNGARAMSREDLHFSDIAKSEFESFKLVLEQMFDIAGNIFKDQNKKDLDKLHELEEQTDNLKEELGNNHFNRIRKNECNNELSPFHSNLLTRLERVADHLTNIGYSIVNPTGDEVKKTNVAVTEA